MNQAALHRPPLWTYWEGPRTPLVELCLESIRRHHPTLQVLDPGAVTALGGAEILERTAGEVLAYRSDLLRWWLMRQFGGAWFDADMIFFRPTGLLAMLNDPDCEVAGFFRAKLPGRPQNPLCDQHFAFRRGSLADLAFETCRRVLDSRSAHYGDTNAKPCQAIWDAAPQRIACQSHWLYSCVPFHNPWRLMLRGDDAAFGRRADLWPKRNGPPYSVHLGGYVMHAFAHLSREQLLSSPTLLGFYLRRARLDA